MIDFHSKEFNDAKPIRFVIPSYQRGYRWREDDVKKLLKDLDAYSGSCYCLQPLELQWLEENILPKWIREKTDYSNYTYYRVVDGQQRLTTISIIAKVLKITLKWDICYDTEKTLLSEILSNIDTQEIQTINDSFRKEVYLCTTEETAVKRSIQNYFNEDCNDKKIVFPIHILSYDQADPEGQDAFSRLNAGKTPLSSSELIRALYMVNDNNLTPSQQTEIAKEWELIESTLQNEQYWKMFNSNILADTPTRIDLLFAMVLYGYDFIKWNLIKPNPRYIFETLETGYYNGEFDLLSIWQEVVRCFWWLQSCFEDIEIYNYLGWIAACTEHQPSTIYKKFLNNSAMGEFKKSLIGLIHDKGIGDTQQVYGNPDLKKLLLLFNILECNKIKERFRFDLLESCDVEHIDSQTPNDLTKYEDRYGWLKSILSEYECPEAEREIACTPDDTSEVNLSDKQIADFCKKEFTDEFLNKLKDVRSQKQAEKISNEHALGNLVLLNSHINRSYKNAVFPQKRKKIIEACEIGSQYLPPCTLKVFMKFYTKEASCLSEWLQCDFESYQKQMQKLLQEFLDIKIPKTEQSEVKMSLKKTNDNQNHSKHEISVSDENSEKELQGEISFHELMGKYCIRIPKIQRLYVQGRSDSFGKKCLHDFAYKLVYSITNNTPLPLDMIYGIANEKIFFPLDGQQRLTTLLLLAWLCGKSNPDWKFDYESRRSTEIFVEYLLKTKPPQIISHSENKEKEQGFACTRYIEKQNWFMSIWKQDSGISGMLKMLDSLYDKLAKEPIKEYCFEKISFTINYLDVADEAYDHIFLKMNSRGRQLSPWENIKAVLDKALSKISTNIDWKENIDFTWPEILWKKSGQSIEDLDACMTDVIGLAARCAGYKDKIEDVFTFDQWLTDCPEQAKKLFNYAEIFFSATKIECSAIQKALTPAWRSEPCIPVFFERNSKNFYKPLLAYYAAEKSLNPDWMRVIWNIIENSEISNSNFQTACELIEKLSEHSANIIGFLSNDSSEISSQFAEKIVRCERQKAKIIDKYPALKGQIISMEKDEFMHGDIAVQLYEAKDSETWDRRHKKLVEYKESVEKKRFQFSKDLLTHLENYAQLDYCFMQGDFVFNDENFHRLIQRSDICGVIANMLDGGEKRNRFSWKDHEPTVERILHWLTTKDTLDVFLKNGYEKIRLQWVGPNLYLHQKGKWYGYFLLNSPLYDILNWLEKKGDIQIANDQMWDGIFNRNIVEFTWNGIKFCSNGTSVWKNEFPDNKLSLFTEGENPACRFNDELANKFLYCCEKLCEKTR